MNHEAEHPEVNAQHPAAGSPGWRPAGPGTGPGHMNLFCPRCAYPLVAVEDIGMGQCPECGADIDFDHLRRLRIEKADIGDFWQLFGSVMWLPGRFFDALPAPRYYVRVGDEYRYKRSGLLLGVIGGWLCCVVWTLLVGPGPGFGLLLLVPVAWMLLVVAADKLGALWVRGLLARAGHAEPLRGEQRIMRLASPPYLVLGLAFIGVMAALPLVLFGSNAALVMLLGGTAAYVYLWLHWAWLVMRAFQAETRSLPTMLDFWAFLNPGLVLGLLTLPLAFTPILILAA